MDLKYLPSICIDMKPLQSRHYWILFIIGRMKLAVLALHIMVCAIW